MFLLIGLAMFVFCFILKGIDVAISAGHEICQIYEIFGQKKNQYRQMSLEEFNFTKTQKWIQL